MPDAKRPSDDGCCSCHAATDPRSAIVLRTHFQPGGTIVQVRGAIGTCMAARLREHVDGLVSATCPLILDLRNVNSFGDDGFRALISIAERSRGRNARWTLVPGETVGRVLRARQADYQLPVAASIEQALQHSASYDPEPSQLRRITPPEHTRW